MKCVKCGTELNASMLRADGALECPNCGAVYRKKNSEAPQPKAAAPTGSDRAGQAARGDAARATLNRAVQYGKNTADALRSDPNVQRAAEAYRAGKAALSETAAETYASGKKWVEAQRTAKAAGKVAGPMLRRGALKPILLALVVVLGIVFGGYAIVHNSGGASLSIFESRDERDVKDLLKRLEKAYNKQDTYALLQLYDPTYTDAMFGMLNLFGLKGDALKSMLPLASQFISQYNSQYGTTDSGTIKVKLLDYETDDSTGAVKYEVTFSFKDGTKQTLTETTDIVKVDDKWYFSYYQSGSGSLSSGTAAAHTPAPPPTPTPKPDYGPVPVNTNLSDSDIEGTMYSFQGTKRDGGLGWGIMNEHGTEVFAPFFDKIAFCGDDFLVTMDNKYWGAVDRRGKMLVDYDLIDAQSLWNGYISYTDSDGRLRALYNLKTGASTPFVYEELGHVDENGLFRAKKGGLWGLIDDRGNVKVDFQYQMIARDITLDGLYPAEKGGYYGLFDTEGNIRVDFRYDELQLYSGDLIAVSLNGAWGLVDGHGTEILPLAHNRKFLRFNHEEKTLFVAGFSDQSNSDYEWSNGQCVNVYAQDGKLLASTPYSTYYLLNKGRILVKQRSEIYHSGYVYRYLLMDAYGNILFDTEPVMHHVIDSYLANHPDRVNSYYLPVINLSQIGQSDYLLLITRIQDMKDNERLFLILDKNGVPLTQSFLTGGSTAPEVFLSHDGTRLFVSCSELGSIHRTKTRVYSFPDMTLLSEHPFALSELHEYGDSFIGGDESTHKYHLMDRNGNSQKQYTSYSGYAIADAGSYAILSDGIYYGVLTDTGFAGNGVAYTEKPTYNSAARVFTLSDGSRKEFYRYNPDGTLTPFS